MARQTEPDRCGETSIWPGKPQEDPALLVALVLKWARYVLRTHDVVVRTQPVDITPVQHCTTTME